MFGAVSEIIRTFDTQINSAIPPPNFLLSVVVGEILFFSYETSITLLINLLRVAKKLFQAFPDSPYL